MKRLAVSLACLAACGPSPRRAADGNAASAPDLVTVSTEPSSSASAEPVAVLSPAPPSPTGVPPALAGAGSTEVELGRILSSNGGVKRCYRNAMEGRAAPVEVNLTVGVTLDGEGKLASTALLRSSVKGNHEFDACVMAAVQRDLLDYQGRPGVEIMHRYRFSAGDMQP